RETRSQAGSRGSRASEERRVGEDNLAHVGHDSRLERSGTGPIPDRGAGSTTLPERRGGLARSQEEALLPSRATFVRSWQNGGICWWKRGAEKWLPQIIARLEIAWPKAQWTRQVGGRSTAKPGLYASTNERRGSHRNQSRAADRLDRSARPRGDQLDELIGHEPGLHQFEARFGNVLLGFAIEARPIGPGGPGLPEFRQRAA